MLSQCVAGLRRGMCNGSGRKGYQSKSHTEGLKRTARLDRAMELTSGGI